MQGDKLNIYIVSEDLVFIRLMEIVFNHYLINPSVEKISSFVDLKEKKIIDSPDFVILDDFIAGASSLEVITFLRFNRRLDCPVYFFCETVPDLAEKAIQRGANRYYTKPFKPWMVAEEIISNLN